MFFFQLGRLNLIKKFSCSTRLINKLIKIYNRFTDANYADLVKLVASTCS